MLTATLTMAPIHSYRLTSRNATEPPQHLIAQERTHAFLRSAQIEVGRCDTSRQPCLAGYNP